MINARSSRTGLATVACATLLLPACEARDCRETEMDARDAAIADAGDVRSSSVLEARLVSRGAPVSGRTVVFALVDDNGGADVVGSPVTDDDGIARLDLKDQPLDLAENVDADRFRAEFHGDSRFCASRDSADLDLVGTP